MSENYASRVEAPPSNKPQQAQVSGVGMASAQPSLQRRAWAWWHAFLHRRASALRLGAALILYLAIALLYFWWPIHSSPTTLAIGSAGPDVGQNFWYLRWWPYALSHGLNPFITYKIWYPLGYNLAWQTSLPGPSLLLYPVASVTGIVMAYNILVIFSFVLTAWTTYILCYHIVRRTWASLIGGYLFGFSGFMVTQASGHIHLLALYVFPLSIYLYLLRHEGRISRIAYLVLAPLPLFWLFLTSVELFTFLALFGYTAIALYWIFATQERRATLMLAGELTAAFVICGILLSPYLYFMAIGYTKGIEHQLDTYSGDVLGFVVPTNLFFFFSNRFNGLPLAGGNGSEQDSYLGLPLVLVMIVFAVKYWSKPIGKVLSLVALLGIAFTLGPIITIANVQIIKSPMYYIYKLPILEKSLPIRYALFVALVGAIMAAVWLAREVKRVPSQIILGITMAVMLVPNLGTSPFVSVPPMPAFFSTSLYQQYIKPSDVVLILPMGSAGSDMSWQQAANFSFALSAGYGGNVPHLDDILPIDYMFYTADASPYLVKDGAKVVGNSYVYYIEHYLATRHVNDIVVAENVYADWSQYLTFLRVAPVHVGSVWYYSVSPALSQASLPGQQVPGDTIPRPYYLQAATWNDQTHILSVAGGTSGEAAETLPDQFPKGIYDLAVTVSSNATPPVAEAQVIVNGVTTTLALASGVTRSAVDVTTDNSTIQIKIMSTGGAAFRVGDTTLSRAS